MPRKKVLLLNPPGDRKYLRGGYCTNESKARYYYPASDLIIQSGILRTEFDVDYIDAVADDLDFPECLLRIREGGYYGLLAVTASCSWRRDSDFFTAVRRECGEVRIILSGGFLLHQWKERLETAGWMDGILLDYTGEGALRFLKGEREAVPGIVIRNPETSVPTYPPVEATSPVRYPVPAHDIIEYGKYHHPSTIRHPFALVHSSFGCPFRCVFCVFSNIPYRVREPGEVVEELGELKRLGIKELMFGDPSFGSDRQSTAALCRAIIEKNLQFGWHCQARVDSMDRELLQLMKKAGCHTIHFGVESANNEILRSYRKNLQKKQIKEQFLLCRKLGIRTLAYFMIGLPGDSEMNINESIEFAKEIKCNFASFNLAVPEVGTELRDIVTKGHYYVSDIDELSYSNPAPTVITDALPASLQRLMKKRAMKAFYLRPGYMIRSLFGIRSFYQLKNHLLEGAHVVSNIIFSADNDR